MNSELRKIKGLLIKLTKEAGAYALANFRTEFEVQYKKPGKKSPVTIIDLEIDTFLRAKIAAAFPAHTILSEELPSRRGSNKNVVWVIDPIDGTGNYINGSQLFSVSIAVIVDGQTVMGTIYSPALKKLYFVEKGKGVLFNGKKLKKQKPSPKNNICFFREQSAIAKKVSQLFPGERLEREHLRCTSVEFTKLAQGLAKCAFYKDINLYDFAAGCLMVEEMGGTVVDFKGKPYTVKSKNLMVMSKSK